MIPGSEKSPLGGHGNPLQYSCLENPTDRRTWRVTVHGVTKSWTLLRKQTLSHVGRGSLDGQTLPAGAPRHLLLLGSPSVSPRDPLLLLAEALF